MSDLVSGGVRRRRRRLVGCLCGLLGLLTACGDDPAPTADAFPVPAWAKVAPEQIAEAKKHGVPVAFENEIGMRFVLIPAGTFLMGSPEDEEGREEWEVEHEVTISRPYYMQIHELTLGQYGYSPEHVVPEASPASRRPAVNVTWLEASEFALRLERELGDRSYTLPSEAKWEYACRAGTSSAYSTGPSISPEAALWRYEDGSDGSRTAAAPVGSYRFNPWGLYDTHGNVWEWCRDYAGIYPADAQVDLVCTVQGPAPVRVMRGGSFLSPRTWARSAKRGIDEESGKFLDIGFRLVSPLPDPGA